MDNRVISRGRRSLISRDDRRFFIATSFKGKETSYEEGRSLVGHAAGGSGKKG